MTEKKENLNKHEPFLIKVKVRKQRALYLPRWKYKLDFSKTRKEEQ